MTVKVSLDGKLFVKIVTVLSATTLTIEKVGIPLKALTDGDDVANPGEVSVASKIRARVIEM